MGLFKGRVTVKGIPAIIPGLFKSLSKWYMIIITFGFNRRITKYPPQERTLDRKSLWSVGLKPCPGLILRPLAEANGN